MLGKTAVASVVGVAAPPLEGNADPVVIAMGGFKPNEVNQLLQV
jgi:hypothetical protein